MRDIVIGCPVSHREWIIDRWFTFARAAAEQAGLEPTFLFVGDRKNDPTFKLIEEQPGNVWCWHTPDSRGSDVRKWTSQRFDRMVELRNMLLAGVRELDPKFFLSLDSDILLHPLALVNMLETQATTNWAAVGGKCYMTPTGDTVPSYGMFRREGQIARRPSSGVHEVDVIMAIKLMTPEAFNVDYLIGRSKGEDINWSRAVKEQGMRIGWDGRVVSKHVMGPHWLDVLDSRCGF